MKQALSVLLLMICATNLLRNVQAANPVPLPQPGDLDVQWKAPANPWPRKLWVYGVNSTLFSPSVISNVMAIASYTTNDETIYGTDGMTFSRPGKPGNLRISFMTGAIEYWTSVPFGPTNLATEVPDDKQMFHLVTNLLPKFGIDVSELVRKKGSTEPRILYREIRDVFWYKGTVITNVQSREAGFSRSLDGVEFIGFDRGGNGEIEFGDHGKILRVSLSWRRLTRDRSYRTATPQTIMKWIREGKVQPQPLPGNTGPIIEGWSGTKCVTIKEAKAVCVGETGEAYSQSTATPRRLRPFASLLATVATATTNVDVGIDCPIFDEGEAAERGRLR